MHKYEELEKIYYKKKKIEYLKKGVAVFIILILSIFFIYIIFINLKTKFIFTTHTTNEIKSKLVLNPIFPHIVIETEDKESENRIENKESKKLKETQLVSNPKTKPVQKDNKENIVNQKMTQEEFVSNNKKVDINSQNNKSPAFKIIVQTKEQGINDFIQSFEKIPTYDVAIKISKLYAKNLEFHKSIEWAKKANSINPENYESWYIFAKSLVKLGKRKKAERILKAYIESYGNNSEIENLLRSLK